MKRGTRVGQAYVALAIDGGDTNEEIVRAVDDAGPGVERAGDEHGQRYGDKFDEGFFQRIKSKILPHFNKEFGDQLESGGSDAGDRAGASAAGHIVDALNHALTSEGHDGNALKALFDKMMTKAEPDARRSGESLGDDFGRSFVRQLEASLASGSGTELGRLFDKLMTETKRRVSGNSSGPSDTSNVGDKIANAFGSGSRNNFIIPFQATAHLAGGIVNIVDSLTKKIGGLFSRVGQGATEAESAVAGVSKGLTDATAAGEGAGAAGSKAMAALAESGPGAAIAIGVVAAAAVALVSVMSALLAIVVALASTIASALTAAALVGAAGLGALSTAAGLVVVAFTSMTDAQRKVLTTDFKPLKAELTGVGQIMLQQIVPSFDSWAHNISRAIALLGPLAQIMGGPIARSGKILTAALSGPGVQKFINELGVVLPSIITNLSAASGHLLNGLLAVFVPVLPYVQQFARYLDEVTLKFTRWANSAQGQNQIADFVARAVSSLRSLWNFLRQVGGLITDILFSSQGQNAGNSIFDSMANAVRHFRSTINAANLERWFKEGTDLASGLGSAFKGLARIISALNSSHAVEFIAASLKVFNGVVKGVAATVDAFNSSLRTTFKLSGLGGLGALFDRLTQTGGFTARQLGSVAQALGGVAQTSNPASSGIGNLVGLMSQLNGTAQSAAGGISGMAAIVQQAAAAMIGALNPVLGMIAFISGGGNAPSASQLTASGNAALNATSTTHGGNVKPPPKTPQQYHNPYIAFANSLIKNGPSISAQIKNAILSVNKQVANAVAAATRASDVSGVTSGLDTLINSITASGKTAVNNARDALNSAAESLASATSAGAAARALRAVKKAQRDLAAALAAQRTLNNEANMLAGQKVVHGGLSAIINAAIGDLQNGKDLPTVMANVLSAFKVGLGGQNATLADFANARNKIAAALQQANQKLADAISLRDSYSTQVSDSIKTFGALTTAQAQVINGVQQALTSNDIVSNLESRLKQIQDFQQNLNLLLAQGLSNDAYKQIVDMGVEAGSQYAAALAQGGSGAVAQVNGLVSSIGDIANTLGTTASSRLYQAGVDAAQGLVDGLTSLSAQLNSAAAQLGTAIANSVKHALGIHSPSTVLRDMMDSVGDGAVLGLDNQQGKVGRAAGRLAAMMAVVPQGAGSSDAATGSVSGNPVNHHWHITTPTADPKAVAYEMMNEMTGRL